MLVIVASESRTANVKIIDLASLDFFVLALIMLLTIGGQIFDRYHIILVWGVFAVVTWATILIGFPFTLQLARENAPREVWSEPLFHRVHLPPYDSLGTHLYVRHDPNGPCAQRKLRQDAVGNYSRCEHDFGLAFSRM
jgi:hypothetical protein